jgi:acetyl esterase/lipase
MPGDRHLAAVGVLMPLDQHTKRLLDMISAGRRDDRGELSAESLRRSMVHLAAAADARRIPIGGLEDRHLPSSAGPMLVRVYTPCGPASEPLPCIVYFHGGTGVFCDVATHDGLCRMLANSSGCRVISVDYRLAPEHPFPAAIEDGSWATSWISAHSSEFGIDSERLIVAGDSAGGTIAAVVCQLAARDNGPRIALQLLICPVTDLAEERESRRAFADGYFIERSTLEWAKDQYCAGADLSDFRISPLRATSLAGLPPAQIHTAEFDPMRDEGEAYANALAEAGVPVQYACHAGLIHHFYCMAGAIPRARTVLASIGDAVRKAISNA